MQTRAHSQYRFDIAIVCAVLALGNLGGCGSRDAGSPATGDEGGEGGVVSAGGGGSPGTGGMTGGSGGSGTGGATGGSGGSGGENAGSGGRAGSGAAGSGGGGSGGTAVGGSGGAGAGGSSAELPDGGDKSSPDGSGGGSTSSGCPADVAFCEDFEGYAMGTVPGAPKWTTATASNMFISMDVDSAHTFSGTKAFHIKANVNNATDTHRAAYIASTGGGKAFPNPSFARFMIYQGSWMKGGGAVHGRVLQMGGAAATFNFSPSMWAFEVINDKYATSKGPEPALNKWVCVEAQFGTTNAFWVEGKSLPASPGGGAPDTLKLGMDTWRTLTAEFWIDDLVVDSKRVNCPPAK